MPAVAFKEVPYVSVGGYSIPNALRANLKDMVHAGSICFWGVQKT